MAYHENIERSHDDENVRRRRKFIARNSTVFQPEKKNSVTVQRLFLYLAEDGRTESPGNSYAHLRRLLSIGCTDSTISTK